MDIKPNELSNQRVTLGLTADEVAAGAGVDALDLLDWEQGVTKRAVYAYKGKKVVDLPPMSKRAVESIRFMYAEKLTAHLRRQRELGRSWQTAVANGWSRTEIRDAWHMEGL